MERMFYRPADILAYLGIKSANFWMLVKFAEIVSQKLGAARSTPTKGWSHSSRLFQSLEQARQAIGLVQRKPLRRLREMQEHGIVKGAIDAARRANVPCTELELMRILAEVKGRPVPLNRPGVAAEDDGSGRTFPEVRRSEGHARSLALLSLKAFMREPKLSYDTCRGSNG